MAYLKLIRPDNVAMSAGGVFVAGIACIGAFTFDPDILGLVVLASLAAALVTAAGNIINDYTDRETDRVNHPERPIPSGQVHPNSALLFSLILFLIPLPLSYLVSIECFLILSFNILVLISYEFRFKRRGLPGNVEISWLTGSIFIFGGFAVFRGEYRQLDLLSRALYLALLAFFATLGREIIKDIEDIAGDTDRQTLPKRMGVSSAAQIAGISLTLAVLLSFLPPFMGVFPIIYLPLVVVADIIFIYSALLMTRNPGKSSTVAKYAMLVALFAFLIGGLTGGT